MKTQTRKSFGVSGITVTLNLLDLYEIRHESERIFLALKFLEEESSGLRSNATFMDIYASLDNAKIFFDNIIKDIPEFEEPSVFDVEKENNLVEE